MRRILENPLEHELLEQATKLAELIYSHHEAEEPYQSLQSELSDLVGAEVTQFQVCSAFGSVSARSFAHDLLAGQVAIPTDLSKEEMLELLQLVLSPKRGELRTWYWLSCLKRNTGDERISDLIFWPGDYFKDGDNSRELTPEEILQIAMSAGGKNGAT